MDEWKRLQHTSRRFRSEMDRIRQGNWVNMPLPLIVLVDALESEPLVSAHLDSCIDALPSPFDAPSEVDRVASEPGACFGPLADETEHALAQAYLIVGELAKRGLKYDDEIFCAYGPQDAPLRDRFARFVDEVVNPLIEGMEAQLAAWEDELRPEGYEEPAAPISNVDAQADTSDSKQEPTIDEVLAELRSSLDLLPIDEQEDATLQLDALEEELHDDEPKMRVVRVLMRGLRLMGKDPRYVALVDRLEGLLDQ